MKTKRLVVFALLCSILSLPLKAEETKKCNFFLLKDIMGEILIERCELTEGETIVYKSNEIVSYVMVFSAGSKSGELIRKEDRAQAIIVKYDSGTIHINTMNEDGTMREMPAINLDKACKSTIRLNITGPGGYQRAYLIERWEEIKADQGPVLDMFQLPLENGDYSLMTESLENVTNEYIMGETAFQIISNWIITECSLNGIVKGKFIVDFGASTTVIPKNFLPKDSDIIKYEMVTYSPEKTVTSKAVSHGGSGTVDNILGISEIHEFSFGNITLKDQKVTVLDQFPDVIMGYDIIGVLGRDILMQAKYIEISNITGEPSEGSIAFKQSKVDTDAYDEILSYQYADGGNIFIDGSIGDIPIHFFFDSGATMSNLSKSFLETNNIEYKQKTYEKKMAYGIDGKGNQVDFITVKDIVVDNVPIDSMEFMMNDVYALGQIGLLENTALLGMNFLLEYNDILFDLANKKIFLR